MFQFNFAIIHLYQKAIRAKKLLSTKKTKIYQIINITITTIIMKKSLFAIVAAGLLLASCGSNCMGKGVNFADTDDAKENYIMTATAEEANCVEVY